MPDAAAEAVSHPTRDRPKRRVEEEEEEVEGSAEGKNPK
jgi:hypothetical protein